MKREEIYEKIKDILDGTFRGEVNVEEINEDTRLIEKLGISSITGIEILVRVESVFGISIDDDDLSMELIASMRKLADYIEMKEL